MLSAGLYNFRNMLYNSLSEKILLFKFLLFGTDIGLSVGSIFFVETKRKMRNLYDQAEMLLILNRLEKLNPKAQKQWGKMNVAQMLAHCSASLETAMGHNTPQKLPFFIRMIGRMLKSSFLSAKPMPKNSGTDKSYIITDDRNFETEKMKVMQLIKTFSEDGPAKCTTAPQVFFGTMTPNEWAIMQWKHFDHHLRQFGA